MSLEREGITRVLRPKEDLLLAPIQSLSTRNGRTGGQTVSRQLLNSRGEAVTGRKQDVIKNPEKVEVLKRKGTKSRNCGRDDICNDP